MFLSIDIHSLFIGNRLQTHWISDSESSITRSSPIHCDKYAQIHIPRTNLLEGSCKFGVVKLEY